MANRKTTEIKDCNKRKKQSKSRKKKNYVNNEDFLKQLLAYKKAVKKNKDLQVPEELAEIFIKIATNLSSYYKFVHYCVDGLTEALTSTGWKKYDEISELDQILALNLHTQKLVWSNVLDVYKNDYQGLMFKLTGKTIDALVTPEHKFITQRGLIPIEKIGAHDYFITMGDAVDDPPETKYDNHFVEIVGLMISLGYIRDLDQPILNLPSKSQKHKKLLEKFGLVQNQTEVWNEIKFGISSSGSVSPEFLLSLNQEQRVLLIQTIINCSGCQYIQRDKNILDTFLMLCTLSGITTHTKRKDDYWIVTLSHKKRCRSENFDFHGGRKKHGGSYKRENSPTFEYDGVIWCPSTSHGNFVCRRGSRIYITGNTYKDEMIADSLENCLNCVQRDTFDPKKSKNPFAYFTRVIFYAFVRRIKKENKELYVKYKSFLESEFYDCDEIEHNLHAVDNLEEQKREFVVRYERGVEEAKQKRRASVSILDEDFDELSYQVEEENTKKVISIRKHEEEEE